FSSGQGCESQVGEGMIGVAIEDQRQCILSRGIASGVIRQRSDRHAPPCTPMHHFSVADGAFIILLLTRAVTYRRRKGCTAQAAARSPGMSGTHGAQRGMLRPWTPEGKRNLVAD